LVKTDDGFTCLAMPCRNDKGELEIEVEATAEPEGMPESKTVKAVAKYKQPLLPNFTAGRGVKW
jgi:hypothetical protein